MGYSALARSTSAAEAARLAESSLVRAGLGGGEIAGFADVGAEVEKLRGRVADTDELPIGAAGGAMGADAPVKGSVGEGRRSKRTGWRLGPSRAIESFLAPTSWASRTWRRWNR